MQKYEMHKLYFDVLNAPSKDSMRAIEDAEFAIKKKIDEIERKRIVEIRAKCEHQREYNETQAQEARIIVTAFLDGNHPMHDFAVKYVDAVRTSADAFENWD